MSRSPSVAKKKRGNSAPRRKITPVDAVSDVILGCVNPYSLPLPAESGFRHQPGKGFIIMTCSRSTTGTAFIMWLRRADHRARYRNGMSLLIFSGIVVGLPRACGALSEGGNGRLGSRNTPYGLPYWWRSWSHRSFIVYVSAATRIPVQYAKRIVGRRVMGDNPRTCL